MTLASEEEDLKVGKIFLLILMGFGAVLVWKRLTGKVSGASCQEEGAGAFFFLFIAGAILLIFAGGPVMVAIIEVFALPRNLFVASVFGLIFISIYLWALFRVHDWVVGKKHSGPNNDK